MSIAKIIITGNDFQFSPAFLCRFIQAIGYQLKMRDIFGDDKAVLPNIFLQPGMCVATNQNVVLKKGC